MRTLHAAVSLTAIVVAFGCGRTTELGSDNTGSGGTGGGGNGSSTAGAGGGEEALGTRFWEDTEGDLACPTVGRPDKSQRPAESGGGNMTLYLGMDTLDLGSNSPDIDLVTWKQVGFNLDLGCNAASWPENILTDSQQGTCPKLRQRACKNEFQNVYDGDYCRDNALGALLGLVAQSPIVGAPFRLTGDDWNCALHKGAMSILFKISGYNGLPNDAAVRLDVYSSTGVTEPANWLCRAGEANSDLLDPLWREQAPQPATKQWQISRRDVRAGAQIPPAGDFPESKWSDATAFVRSGWLIAELPDNTEIWLNGLNAETSGFRFVLNNALLAARLEQDPATDQWRFSEATLGATAKPGDLITSFRELGYCENLCDSYTTTLGYLNQQVDMLSSTHDAVPDATCDAQSFGMAFTARTISPGPVVDVPAPPDVSGGKCGTPRNPDVPPPGCGCVPGGACE
ncbi:MAG: hypothetical protein KC492_05755 [Myxococcales bacterium]|nr:hypothetical protein [Myxococcales bacterium]